jgi:hypothetical protein
MLRESLHLKEIIPFSNANVEKREEDDDLRLTQVANGYFSLKVDPYIPDLVQNANVRR